MRQNLGIRRRTPRKATTVLTCAGGRRLLALGAHRGAPAAPPPAAPALSRGRQREAGAAPGGWGLAQALGPELADPRKRPLVTGNPLPHHRASTSSGRREKSRRARSTAKLRGRREACAGASEAGATGEVAAGYTHRDRHKHVGTRGTGKRRLRSPNRCRAAPRADARLLGFSVARNGWVSLAQPSTLRPPTHGYLRHCPTMPRAREDARRQAPPSRGRSPCAGAREAASSAWRGACAVNAGAQNLPTPELGRCRCLPLPMFSP